MSGTPVLTSDWGAFAEIVNHGVTGYRCHTMDHLVWAAKEIHKLSPKACREWAMKYSMDRIVTKYEEYFKMIHDHHSGKGDEVDETRTNLDWINT